ncbi:MAG: hypothetical protein WC807_07955 [Hyphomicrobium sp.]|jgi:hypothetical protein
MAGLTGEFLNALADELTNWSNELVFWIGRLIPGEGRQAAVNPEHEQKLG